MNGHPAGWIGTKTSSLKLSNIFIGLTSPVTRGACHYAAALVLSIQHTHLPPQRHHKTPQ
jgi:TRAP-type mannitol/chloroaromatic compound transport system permease large subunit